MGADVPGPVYVERFPFVRTHPLEPPPAYERLRSDRPVAGVRLADGTRALLVTRYEDVQTVLRDPRFSREALSRTGPGELVAGTARRAERAGGEAGHSTPYRLVAGALSPRAVSRLAPWTARLVDELLDAMQSRGAPADLVARLARPLPAAVMGRVLGIPEPDRVWFQQLSSGTVVFQPTDRSRQAVQELRAYVGRLLESKRDQQAEDLCSSLVRAHDGDPEVLPWEKVVTLVLRVAAAGLHSVVVSLSKGLPLLLRHRPVYAALRADAGGVLAGQVIEELLRLTSPAPTSLSRLALADITLAGTGIAGGSVIMASLESANYDPTRYPNPGALIPERGSQQHTAFGAGPNYCIGAGLARMELQTAITALTNRFPDLHLTIPDARLVLRESGIAPDVREVPVSW